MPDPTATNHDPCDSEVDSLIRIADAGVRVRKRGPVTLWLFRYDHRYELQEQVDAIRKLANSSNPKARKYLAALLERRECFDGPRCFDTRINEFDVEPHRYFIFPNARGPLKEALESWAANGDMGEVERFFQTVLLPLVKGLEANGDYDDAASLCALIGMKPKSEELYSRVIGDLESADALEEAARIARKAGLWQKEEAIRLKIVESAERNR